jgi:tRNA-dependent cyclodipeptide synthase
MENSLFNAEVIHTPHDPNISDLYTHKASFRVEGRLLVNKQDLFKNKRAVLFISVGQTYHEKGKFLSTIELLNRYAFQQVDIMMADTLQRFNHYGRLDREAAWNFAKQAGDAWLNRNAFALSRLEIPHSISRWDTLLGHSDYPKLKALVLDAFKTDLSYRDALYTNVKAYLERLQAISPNVDTETLFSYGLEYLIEECPIVMPLWAEMGYDFIIYPKPLTVAMQKTRDLFLINSLKDKCNWVYLRFKK